MSDIQNSGSLIHWSAAILFFFAVAHTFSVKRFRALATAFPKRSPIGILLYLLSEVELVFGVYAILFIAFISIVFSKEFALSYLSKVSFGEPLFVLTIMLIAATHPVLRVARILILGVSRLLPLHSSVAFYATTLSVGPLLGSFITEPAAMTVTALLLKESYYDRVHSKRFLYSTLGLLFVNISTGGTLTPFAAPPVLMVASKFGWDLTFMFTHFGYKTIAAVLLSTMLVTRLNLRELKEVSTGSLEDHHPSPIWVIIVTLAFLAGTVVNAHHPIVLVALLALFLGFGRIFEKFMGSLKLKEAAMVSFFLAGLAVLGAAQGWWVGGLITNAGPTLLFFGSTALTAVVDNAALTYLGSQVPGLSELSKYLLVAGSVAGGGLTVIANAPNPVGYEILSSRFGPSGVSPLMLFLWALPPTIIAMLCYVML